MHDALSMAASEPGFWDAEGGAPQPSGAPYAEMEDGNGPPVLTRAIVPHTSRIQNFVRRTEAGAEHASSLARSSMKPVHTMGTRLRCYRRTRQGEAASS